MQTKEEYKKYHKDYYLNNKHRWKGKSKDQRKKYYSKNKRIFLDSAKKYCEGNRESWGKIIPKETNCQVCGKTIYYKYLENKNLSIHFDHKHEEHNDKYFPSQWLYKKKPTPENIAEWKSFDFGMLCGRCNSSLPTVGREEWVRKVNKYVFGV